jgi:secreted Zn-dependent insulinase-like peptidase
MLNTTNYFFEVASNAFNDAFDKEMLHNFYQNNYSSNLMKLVVYCSDTPDKISTLSSKSLKECPIKITNDSK